MLGNFVDKLVGIPAKNKCPQKRYCMPQVQILSAIYYVYLQVICILGAPLFHHLFFSEMLIAGYPKINRF